MSIQFADGQGGMPYLDMMDLEAYHAWLAGDWDGSYRKTVIDQIKAFIFSPEADEIHSIAATELGATA